MDHVAERSGVLVVATKGAGSNDERRILELLADFDPVSHPFERGRKAANLPRLLRRMVRDRPRLVVLEGTGIVGGVAVMLGRLLLGIPYVVSSGDAVGPFLAGTRAILAVPGWIYEALLCRLAAGFIGWTPYLVGRALTFGSPRAVTAAGFAQHPRSPLDRNAARERLGIPRDALVFGIAGSLDWNERRGYCYGLELVRARAAVDRDDVVVLVVGGGSGLERLRRLAGARLGRHVLLPGPVPPEEVPTYLAAMDVGSLPQSLDQVGMFRYTTKISEYVDAQLPIVTGRLPLAYDIAETWSWRLPGEAPWADDYVNALARLMTTLKRDDVAAMRAGVPADLDAFDRGHQRRRVAAFVDELLMDTNHRP